MIDGQRFLISWGSERVNRGGRGDWLLEKRRELFVVANLRWELKGLPLPRRGKEQFRGGGHVI